ncbi:MAG: hypothetical protein Q9219_003996 [cf. Caloplaca sp. 3 TL-2023]
MELSRQEYPALLQTLQPSQAVAVLDDRVKLIGKVNLDIAEWLSERRRIEEAYVQGLKKLGARHPNTASVELGIFQTPWQSIISSTESLANSHSQLAQRMEADVERPLRTYQRESREMQAMSTIQGNLAAVAKELDAAQRRVEKIKAGKSTASKIAEATSSAEAIDREWQSQAPYVFEQLQALDENRVNHLRDVLTQLQTHEADQVERSRVSAESCLNVLLNVDTKEEISTFVARTSAGAPPTMQPTTRSRTVSGNMLSTTPSRAQDDRASEISATSEGGLRPGSTSGPPPPTPESKPRFGLRRLGTVMTRRKEGKKLSERPPSPEKRSRPNLNPLRRGTSSRNMQTIPSPDEEAMPIPKSAPQREPTTPPPNPSQNSAVPPSPQQWRTNGGVNGDAIQPVISRSSHLSSTNGIQTAAALAEEEPPVPPLPATEIGQTQRDGDGFNVAPPTIDEISRAEREAAASEPDQPQFRLDIRSEPIHEEDHDAESALSSTANALRAHAQQIPTPRKPTTNRGRRDVRNTVFVPSPQPPDFPGAGESPIPPPSTFSAGKASSLSSDAPQGSDAHSIRSAHSMSSLVQTAAKHPEMTEPGLNASVVESVSAWFSSGQVTKAVVIGELALVYNASETNPAASIENIRLENFPVLEKVAPNPSFVTQTPSRSGEYSVNLAQMFRTAVAFKYQVHLEESNLAAHAPIVITPSWRIEPKQVSVIVSYAFNPAFVSPASRSVTMKNVVVMVNLDSTKAQTCQSKPVGNFSKEKSLIYWKLGDITLDGYAETPQKLLARFGTETEGKPGSVEARWEISGEAAAGLGSGLGLSRPGSLKEEGSSDPFADESVAASPSGAWKEVKVHRKLVSGKYVADR